MKSLEFTTNSPEETRQLGRNIGSSAQPGDVCLLSGRLGAGKTCLTQGIAWGLGITEYAASPTFVLMREMTGGRLPLYHIDLYRLDHLEEIADLGLDDYFYAKGVCVVEWAEKGINILPTEHLQVQIHYVSEERRRFVISPNGRRYKEMIVALGSSLKDGRQD